MLKTVQEVARIRSDFNGFLAGFNSDTSAYSVSDPALQSELEQLPNYKDIVAALPKGQIYKQAFSDSNIWFTPVSDEHGNHFARQIAFIVMGVAFAHLFALSRGTACRGGIALGNGTDALNKLGLSHGDEIYGPVLKTAYDLENRHAVYPRVVVADRFIEFMAGLQSDTTQMEPGSVDQAIAINTNVAVHYLKSLTAMDFDGAIVVDYAGEFASSMFKPLMENKDINPEEVFLSAFRFVHSQLERFTQDRNYKLSGRYESALRYLKIRSHNWTTQKL
mgnify:CR=1 FL=1